MSDTTLGELIKELKNLERSMVRKRQGHKVSVSPGTRWQARSETLVGQSKGRTLERKLSVSVKPHRPERRAVTFRCDGEVLAWLKAAGNGYHTRINAILRRAMLEDRKQE